MLNVSKPLPFDALVSSQFNGSSQWSTYQVIIQIQGVQDSLDLRLRHTAPSGGTTPPINRNAHSIEVRRIIWGQEADDLYHFLDITQPCHGMSPRCCFDKLKSYQCKMLTYGAHFMNQPELLPANEWPLNITEFYTWSKFFESATGPPGLVKSPVGTALGLQEVATKNHC